MSTGEALLAVLSWDAVVLVLWAAYRAYRRSQRRLERGAVDVIRMLGVSAVTDPVLHPVTEQAPMVIAGQVISIDQAPIPVWMREGPESYRR